MLGALPHTPPEAEMTLVPELREAQSLDDQRVAAIDLAARGVAEAMQKGNLIPAVVLVSRALRDQPAAAEAAIKSGIIEGMADQESSQNSEGSQTKPDEESPLAKREFTEADYARRAAIERTTLDRLRNNNKEALAAQARALAHVANSGYYLAAIAHRYPDIDDSRHDH
jgi:hypothetical protein